MGDGARSVVVQLFVVVSTDVAARENIFKMLRKRRVDGHQVFELSMLRAFLDHQDLAIAFDDLGLDLADRFIEEDLVVDFAVDDLLADFGNAPWAE